MEHLIARITVEHFQVERSAEFDLEHRMPNGTSDRADRARLRLAREIAALPRWGTPALWARLRSHDPQTSASSGALVSYLRTATRRRDTSAAREIFILFLGRMERLNREWASRTVARTPSLPF
jgi:hypothetical protein